MINSALVYTHIYSQASSRTVSKLLSLERNRKNLENTYLYIHALFTPVSYKRET